MEDEGSGWSVAFETEKGVEFMDLPLIITIQQDLSALNSKVWAPETEEDIRLKSFIKACSKGNLVLLEVNLGTLTWKVYSSIMLIAAKKMIIERV